MRPLGAPLAVAGHPRPSLFEIIVQWSAAQLERVGPVGDPLAIISHPRPMHMLIDLVFFVLYVSLEV